MFSHCSIFQEWDQLDNRLGSQAIKIIQDAWFDRAENDDQVSVI